jgi:hypothetical protein
MEIVGNGMKSLRGNHRMITERLLATPQDPLRMVKGRRKRLKHVSTGFEGARRSFRLDSIRSATFQNG